MAIDTDEPRRVYRIVLRGPVPDRMLAPYLDEFEIVRTKARTTLTGPIVDTSQLHGLLSHITSTGIDIIELTSASAPSPST